MEKHSADNNLNEEEKIEKNEVRQYSDVKCLILHSMQIK